MPDPYLFRRRSPQRGAALGSLDANRLVIVLRQDLDGSAGTDSRLMQKKKQLGIALIEADDRVPGSFRSIGEREKSFLSSLRGASGNTELP